MIRAEPDAMDEQRTLMARMDSLARKVAAG